MRVITDNPNCQYLSPGLSISKMYHLYKDICIEKTQPQVSEWMYTVKNGV